MMQALRRYYRGATLAGMVDVATGERRNYFFDHQGTVQCLTDMQGNVTDRFASDAWGVTVKRTGTSLNRQWYVGNLGYYRQVDQALDYVRARYASARVGSWISMDPLPNAQRTYALADNNPSRYQDASGWQVAVINGPLPSGETAEEFCERARRENPGTNVGGGTDCNPETGRPFTVICKFPGVCEEGCLRHHEGLHRLQLASCCQKYASCLRWARKNQKDPTPCHEKWLSWRAASFGRSECEALKHHIDCLQEMIARNCKPCLQYEILSFCCDDFRRQLAEKQREHSTRDCSNVNPGRLPCPFVGPA